MISLDKQLGPFPLKIWLIIGVAGVGIGYLVTRKTGASASSSPANNDRDIAAINALSSKIVALSLANESVGGVNATQNTILQSLTEQLAKLQSKLDGLPVPQSVSPTKQPDTGKPVPHTGSKIWSKPGDDISKLIGNKKVLSFYLDKYGNQVTNIA